MKPLIPGFILWNGEENVGFTRCYDYGSIHSSELDAMSGGHGIE